MTSDEIYDQAGYECRLQEATDLYAGQESPDFSPALWRVSAVADEQPLLKQSITDYIHSSTLDFVSGTMNLERD